MNPTRIGITAFAAAAIAGPWYTVEGYSLIRDVISLLGAQNTPNRSVMVAGFVALGIGIVVDGARGYSKYKLPFIAFGLCMGLAGLLAHRPLSADVDFSQIADQAHSVLATLAGISITAGLLWEAARSSSIQARVISVSLAALCLGLPLCMLAFPDVQGIVQRLMYLLIFSWLWFCYPSVVFTRNEPLDTA